MENTPVQNESRPPFSGTAIILLIIAIIVILGAAALFLLRRPNQPTMPAIGNTPTTTSNFQQPPIIPAATNTAPVTAATSTATNTAPVTEIQPEEDEMVITLGERFQIFKGDTVTIKQKNGTPRWSVKAINFSDSRCPQGVQCIWAGEQNVTVTVTDLIARVAPQDITLGTTTKTTQSVYGVTLTLSAIEDGKGGTYAEIETK